MSFVKRDRVNCGLFFSKIHFTLFGELNTILSKINSPEDLKKISEKELPCLAAEIRKKIIDTVAKNGGHLASNLGVVELTIALHRVFNSPRDAIIFDVSHQSYTHKLLTGRYKGFYTLRKSGGLSGFQRKAESEHDYFDNGHSSTSISQGLGLLTAWDLQKVKGEPDRKVVVVIGDGALTGGMAYEALSHAGQLSKNLIVVLNDNQMSISPNDSAISRYLSSMTMTGFYQKFRYAVDHLVDKIPESKRHIGKIIYKLKRGIKGMFLVPTIFSDLGFEYVGPLDGHNIKKLEETLSRVKKLPKPVVVHIRTVKGKGYSPAENDPASFHGVGPFQISDGKMEKFDALSFTEAFSNTIVALAAKNKKIAAITAAMSKGTGLDAFSRHYPERFFDVGIAEEHAVTFASGLAAGGMIPVCAIYSTFIQRAVDQIIHDVALQKNHVVLCLDRAGVVPNDGETHQGLFDIPLLRPVPNLTILSPATAVDLNLCLVWAVNAKKPVAIRYPKLSCPSEHKPFEQKITEGRGIFLRSEEFAPSLNAALEDFPNHKKLLFVCTGGIFDETLIAARNVLMKGTEADIYSLRFIKPFDDNYFVRLAKNYSRVVVVEDCVRNGGIGEYIENLLFENGYNNILVKSFPDKFIPQGTRSEICEACGMNGVQIAADALAD